MPTDIDGSLGTPFRTFIPVGLVLFRRPKVDNSPHEDTGAARHQCGGLWGIRSGTSRHNSQGAGARRSTRVHIRLVAVQIRGPTQRPDDFHNTLLRFQGGTKQCAICEGSGGVLPCSKVVVKDARWGKPYSKCPDNLIVKNQLLFFQIGRDGGAFCGRLDDKMCISGATFSTDVFPTLRDEAVVMTKCAVTHPHRASRRHGIVGFKRIVRHKCKGGPGCKAGSIVADVQKAIRRPYSNRLICSWPLT